MRSEFSWKYSNWGFGRGWNFGCCFNFSFLFQSQQIITNIIKNYLWCNCLLINPSTSSSLFKQKVNWRNKNEKIIRQNWVTYKISSDSTGDPWLLEITNDLFLVIICESTSIWLFVEGSVRLSFFSVNLASYCFWVHYQFIFCLIDVLKPLQR